MCGCIAVRLWSRRAFPSAPWRERLGGWGLLLLLEGFCEALQAQVVVPHLGETLVLLMEADEVDIVAALDCAAPLLYADVVVPVVEGVKVWSIRQPKLKTHLGVAHEVAVLFAVVTDRDCRESARA